ncbi:MAG: ATP-binding protein, partial [Bacteroidia bacterium]
LHAFVRVADKSVQASTEMVFVLKYAAQNRDFRFEYSQKEDKIMKYLAENDQITLAQAEILLKLPTKTTSITLVTLVRAGILQIHATAQGDYFCLAEKAFG